MSNFSYRINDGKEASANALLYVFKLGHKAAEATRNINNIFDQGTVKRTYGATFVPEIS